MKKSDTEQEQPGLEENKVPDSQSKRELDRELQELAEKEHQEEIYYEERRRERHERNLKRKKRQIRNRNLALIITALAVLGGVGYFYREQTGLKDGMETLVAKVRDLDNCFSLYGTVISFVILPSCFDTSKNGTSKLNLS